MNNLNVGSGDRFHTGWVNLDCRPTSPKVRRHDLRSGIPFPDGSFDVVYHSHVLEHFSRSAGLKFLGECHRVLKGGGILRVAVPDLECIARLYLDSLEDARRGVTGARDNYDWMVLEMYDQTVRERTGGELVEYLRQDPIPNWDFVRQRWGVQADILLDSLRREVNLDEKHQQPSKRAWGYLIRNPGTVLRNKLARMILGEDDWKALQFARFRREGEIHLWMYDSYSLARLLQSAGFAHTQRFGAAESQIPGWSAFHLDTEPDGNIYKPDSLFMEAIRP